MTNLVDLVTAGIASLWLGSMEYRMRKVREDTANKIDRQEVSELIDLKNEASQVRHKELKEDVTEIKVKLDKLHDLLLK